ncbi:MAG TPA: S-adenosylmethionine decarboxylase [Gemmatimonadaceae bacterium]|nr:S-adenosylmethionine decarboxylase [Gemmatimonadaceae bacterium]
MGDRVTGHGPPPLVHRTADFRGVTSPLLRDGAALAGLLLSAAGAAGLSTAQPPVVHALPRDGLAVVLLLDLGHVVVHTMPARELLLVDLLVPAGRDPQKAVDVFTRKLGTDAARSGRLDRG